MSLMVSWSLPSVVGCSLHVLHFFHSLPFLAALRSYWHLRVCVGASCAALYLPVYSHLLVFFSSLHLTDSYGVAPFGSYVSLGLYWLPASLGNNC